MADFINTIDVIGDDALCDGIITKSITEFHDDTVTSIGIKAFYSCTNLVSVDVPAVTSIENHACYECTNLARVNLPEATSIGQYAFTRSNLSSVDLPKVTSIQDSAFRYCSNLTTVILRSDTVCTLGMVRAFGDTPIASKTGYFYVPRALVDAYIAKTYTWGTYASQFRALEDYTVDGTITGELDPNKI